MNKKSFLYQAKVHSEKYFRKFMNFTRHQKVFVLFLMTFTLAVLLFPIARISPVADSGNPFSLWLIGTTFFKSFLVIALALSFLFGRNMNISFKSMIVKWFGFRESEPVLNFIFLWIIASGYMGMLDTFGLARTWTGSIALARGLRVQLLILLVGIGISLVDVRKSANQNSQKTKILNIIEDDTPKAKENKRVLQHLFEDEELE